MHLVPDLEHDRLGGGGMSPLSSEARGRVRDEVAQACEAIAQSWPMKTFAYRNPLRGWEHLPFVDAICQAKQVLGGNGFLPNEDYRQLYREGRMTEAALQQALQAVATRLHPQSVTLGDRSVAAADVLRLHLLFGLCPLEPALLAWQLHGGAALKQCRNDLPASVKPQHGDSSYLEKLWASTLATLNLSDPAAVGDARSSSDATTPNIDLPSGRALSDWVGMLGGATLTDQINDQLIKWTGAFLDEGLADWKMPSRHEGFYRAWRALAARDLSGHLLGIRRYTAKVQELPEAPEDAVGYSLQRLGIPDDRWTDYLARLLAQLPGWTGLIRWLGENPGYPAQQQHPIDPLQYLAVRLFYEVQLVENFCRREWGIEGTLPALVSHWKSRPEEYRTLLDRSSPSTDAYTQAVCDQAWRLFHLAQFLALSPDDVKRLSPAETETLFAWLDAFPAEEHGPVWLDALETTYRNELIERLSAHRGAVHATEGRPRAQLVLCIDARSESFRRHIEAQGAYETFGFAGFFGIPISFQAFDSSERAALCPVIVAPGHEVDELPRAGENRPLNEYAAGSRWSRLGHEMFHDLKSNPVGSFLLIDMLGLFFCVRLIGKTFVRAPYASIMAWVQERFAPRVGTHTPVDRLEEPDPEPVRMPHGFTPEEQATFVEKGLRAIGLTSNFGRLIVLCGHGSTSDNNPYFAAYNCGACGGGHGDPNARVFATMANQPHVRQTLKEHGLDVPDDTWFLAAKHNTATDQVTFYDLQDLPAGHADDLHQLAADLAEAGRHQALERCQRLPLAPKNISPAAAAEYMTSVTVDWTNVRPEWGLSSNAAFVLGRRELTKGLDLGGRVFLHSYDSAGDSDGAILEGLMNAPLVVAQWISMEYYFSAVDPTVYGSGSKVTHNVVSGVGVMHGSHGDLQAGLPLQSVNDGSRHYHEPVRLLAIIEAPTSRISTIIQKYTLLQHLFNNQWVQLMAIDPATQQFHRYHPDATWEAQG